MNARDETELGTSDIIGVDTATNQRFGVAAAVADQSAAAIAGSLVVYEDTRHSCPTCERDIRSKNVATGVESTVATGAANQTQPAIAGSTVVWLERTSTAGRVLSRTLPGSQVTQIATAPAQTALGAPRISDHLIVWTEQTRQGRGVHHIIRAYDRVSGVRSVVAETNWIGLTYTLSGRRVLWTDPRLMLTDLATGTTRMLDYTFSVSPAISGDIVTWSRDTPGLNTGFDLYWLNLSGSPRLPLVIAPGHQVGAALDGDLLAWQNEEGRIERVVRDGFNHLVAAPIIEIPPRPQPLVAIQAQSVRKGIHTPVRKPTYDGWAPPSVDVLGAPNTLPNFGSFVVLDTELEVDTQRAAPWGPKVWNAMAHAQSQGATVVVRTFSTLRPNPEMTVNPSDAVNEVINLLSRYDWIRHIQIHNEPNLEWTSEPYELPCTNCRWTSGGQTRTYSWEERKSRGLYDAINAFYTDVGDELAFVRNNHADQVIRDRLGAVTLWPPPLSDIYTPLTSLTTMRRCKE